MNIKKVQTIKNPETDPTERLERIEDLINKLNNDVIETKTHYNIKDKFFGKKISSFEEKMKKIYENINYLRTLHDKEIKLKEVEDGYLNSNSNSNLNSGINNVENTNMIQEEKKIMIPSKLAKFLNINEKIELTKKILLQKVWQEFEKRNLIYEKNKRVLRVDAEASELFEIPISVNNSIDHRDKNGFNYSLLQKKVENMLY